MRKRNLVTAILTLLLCGASARANDFNVNPPGPVFSLGNLQWGTTGSNGFNNNYYFSPLNITESVCVFVYNNNPTNAHIFSASITVTVNQNEKTPSDGTWNIAAQSTNIVAAISPSNAANISASVSGVALVAVSLSGSSVLGGSPDTANVVISQTQNGTCFSGQNTSATPTVIVKADEPIQAEAEALSTSFYASAGAVNPAASQDLLIQEATATSKSIYFARLLISSTVADTVNVDFVTTAGATCVPIAQINTKMGSTVTSASLSEINCTTHPTQVPNSGIGFFVGANQTVTVDLSGDIAPGGNILGIDVINGSAVTGTVSAVVYWYEK